MSLSPEQRMDKQRQDIARQRAEQFRSEHPAVAGNAVKQQIIARRNQVIEMEAKGIDGAAEGLAATEKFCGAYPSIAKDPALFRVAGAMDRQLADSGNFRDAWDRMQTIGERLSTVVSNPHVAHEIRQGSTYGDPTEVAKAVLLADLPTTDGEHESTAIIEKMQAQRNRARR